MTSLATHVKRFVGPIIANRWTGIAAARVLGDRIPHRGLTIDTSSPVVDPKTKAALLVNDNASAKFRFVQHFVEHDLDALAKARLIIMETHGIPGHGSHDDLVAAIPATGRFALLDRYGPVVVLQPRG